MLGADGGVRRLDLRQALRGQCRGQQGRPRHLAVRGTFDGDDRLRRHRQCFQRAGKGACRLHECRGRRQQAVDILQPGEILALQGIGRRCRGTRDAHVFGRRHQQRMLDRVAGQDHQRTPARQAHFQQSGRHRQHLPVEVPPGDRAPCAGAVTLRQRDLRGALPRPAFDEAAEAQVRRGHRRNAGAQQQRAVGARFMDGLRCAQRSVAIPGQRTGLAARRRRGSRHVGGMVQHCLQSPLHAPGQRSAPGAILVSRWWRPSAGWCPSTCCARPARSCRTSGRTRAMARRPSSGWRR
ncbi:hypothetical protein D3C81_1227140 [compost metagenome]